MKKKLRTPFIVVSIFLCHALQIFTLTVAWSPVLAQQAKEMDSLKQWISSQEKEDSNTVKQLLRISELYYETGNIDSVPVIAEKMLTISKAINWDKGNMLAYALLGEYYGDITQNQKAIPYLFKALHLAEKLNDIPKRAECSKNIAFAYMYAKDAPNAIKWFKSASKYFGELKQKKYEILCTASIGVVYHTDSMSRESLPFFEKALEMAEELKDTYVTQYVKSQYAMPLSQLGKSEKALTLLEDIMLFSEQNSPPPDLASFYTVLSDVYHDVGKQQESDLYAEKALDLARKYNFWGPGKAAASNLSQSNALKGNYKKAYQYLLLENQYSDSLEINELREKTEVLELKFEDEKKALQIQSLENENAKQKLQRIMLLSGISILAILFLSAWLVNRSLQKRNKVIEEQKNEITILNKDLEMKVRERTSELEQAMSDIKGAIGVGQSQERKRIATDLHDNLGSVLTTINMNLSAMDSSKMGAREQELYRSLVQMTEDAYREVRLISHNLSPKELNENGLSLALRRLVEKLNLANKTAFIFRDKGYERLNTTSEINVYSAVLELCNNIQKHAKASLAKIEIRTEENRLFLEISDDGKGYDPDEKSTGIGLQNAKERIQGIGGELTIKSSKSGTSILILLNTVG